MKTYFKSPVGLVVLFCLLGVLTLPTSAAGTLALYLPFDEASDATAFADASGNDFTATCPGDCPTPGVSGKVDGALSFDGTDDYVQVPYNAAFNPAGSFTVAAWAKVTGGAGTYRSVVTSRGNGYGYIIYATADNQWQFWIGHGSGWEYLGNTSVALDQWTHLAGVYDSATQLMQFYVNGQPAGSQSGAAFAHNTECPLRVGAGATEQSPLFFFPGEIDEVRVYDGALSQAEIQQIAAPEVYAADDAYTVRESATLTAPAPGVLENDVSTAGTLTATVETPPAQGDLALALDGGFVYTPTSGYTGTVTFTYRASARTLTDTAMVTLTVEPNVAPVALDDAYTTDELTPLSVAAPGVLDNDSDANGDTLTATLTTAPSRGALALDLDGSFVYTPALGFPGEYTFTYEASDGTLSDTATVTLTVEANLAPAAQDDAYTVYQNVPLTVAAPGVLGQRQRRPRARADRDPRYRPQSRHGGDAARRLLHLHPHDQLPGHRRLHLRGERRRPRRHRHGDPHGRPSALPGGHRQRRRHKLRQRRRQRRPGGGGRCRARGPHPHRRHLRRRAEPPHVVLPDRLHRPGPDPAGRLLAGRLVVGPRPRDLSHHPRRPAPGARALHLRHRDRHPRRAQSSPAASPRTTAAAVYASTTEGTLTVTQSTFAANEAGNGGALYAADALAIAGSTFTANHAYDGGGVYAWGNALTISDTLFYTNTADYNGGVLYSENNVLTLEEATLRDNGSGESGGVYITNSGDGTSSPPAALSRRTTLRTEGVPSTTPALP